MVCHTQLSPGFDKCFVICAKQNRNNVASFSPVGACILLNIFCWFVYQNESEKTIVFGSYFLNHTFLLL